MSRNAERRNVPLILDRALLPQLRMHAPGVAKTIDAMPAQQEVARCMAECGADYVMTAVKENQPTILANLQSIGWTKAERFKQDVELGHGRPEHRRCEVVYLSGTVWDGYCALHGRLQALRIERRRELIKCGTVERETAYNLTSLSTEAGLVGIADYNYKVLQTNSLTHSISVQYLLFIHFPQSTGSHVDPLCV